VKTKLIITSLIAFSSTTIAPIFLLSHASSTSLKPAKPIVCADKKQDTPKLVDHIYRCNERRVEAYLATEYADKVAKEAAYNATCEQDG
jgi:hypothetical protein